MDGYSSPLNWCLTYYTQLQGRPWLTYLKRLFNYFLPLSWSQWEGKRKEKLVRRFRNELPLFSRTAIKWDQHATPGNCQNLVALKGASLKIQQKKGRWHYYTSEASHIHSSCDLWSFQISESLNILLRPVWGRLSLTWYRKTHWIECENKLSNLKITTKYFFLLFLLLLINNKNTRGPWRSLKNFSKLLF
jgi:hypothetical protein